MHSVRLPGIGRVRYKEVRRTVSPSGAEGRLEGKDTVSYGLEHHSFFDIVPDCYSSIKKNVATNAKSQVYLHRCSNSIVNHHLTIVVVAKS